MDSFDFDSWWDSLLDFLPNLFWALVIFTVFVLVAKIMRYYIELAVSRVSKQQAVITLIARIGYVILIIIGGLFALKAVNLDGVVTSVLAGAGIIGIALGFAFQDIASNFIAGIIIAVQKQFNVGDLVEIGETFGIVKKIELRTTTIRTLEGQNIYIPNKDVFTNVITDYSQLKKRRVDLTVGVSYSDDLQKAEDLALEAVKSVEGLINDDPIDLYYEEFADSSINFTLRFWVKFSKQPDYLKARSEAIKSIQKAFQKGGITIPFPIRTLDFEAPVGSRTLAEHLNARKKQ